MNYKKVMLALIWPVLFAAAVNAASLKFTAEELDQHLTGALQAAAQHAQKDQPLKAVVRVSAVWDQYKTVKVRKRYGLNKASSFTVKDGALKTNCQGVLAEGNKVFVETACFLPQDGVLTEANKVVVPGTRFLRVVEGDKEARLSVVSFIFHNRRRVQLSPTELSQAGEFVYFTLPANFAMK